MIIDRHVEHPCGMTKNASREFGPSSVFLQPSYRKGLSFDDSLNETGGLSVDI